MMFECTSVLFLNCLGSYLYSIIKTLGGKEALNVFLGYLAKGKLSYENLDLEAIFAKYKNNPWGYQPITIKNFHDGDLTINIDFFDYLYKNFNIVIQMINASNTNNVLNDIVENCSKGLFCICNVDEYYIPSSLKFYHKKHNKHFLLIDTIDTVQKRIHLIDSERTTPISLSFEELNNSIQKSVYKKMLIYKVDCTNYKLNRQCHEEPLNLLIFKSPIDAIMKLIKEMDVLTDSNPLLEYFFQGYYYTLLSKITPYLMMMNNELRKIDQKYYLESKEIAKDLKSLVNFMKFKIYKHQYDLHPILKKLQLICDKCICLYQKIGNTYFMEGMSNE